MPRTPCPICGERYGFRHQVTRHPCPASPGDTHHVIYVAGRMVCQHCDRDGVEMQVQAMDQAIQARRAQADVPHQ